MENWLLNVKSGFDDSRCFDVVVLVVRGQCVGSGCFFCAEGIGIVGARL